VINEQTHPTVFILLFIFLPIIGFPIILFLILLGIKFGIETGILIMFLCLPIHMVTSFLLANNFLRPVIENYAKKKGYRFPQMSESRLIWFSIVFMIVPGLSYTMKNYILALSGISFGHYFLIGCVVNSIMGLPFIIAGHAAAGKSLLLLAVIFLFFLAAYKFGMLIKKRYYKGHFKENG
ncbi:MAG TPA: hypothetical protein ENO27_00095, partial [Caldithrix sp.]|nr:hypothetical protein [Caldithrix sp.]